MQWYEPRAAVECCSVRCAGWWCGAAWRVRVHSTCSIQALILHLALVCCTEYQYTSYLHGYLGQAMHAIEQFLLKQNQNLLSS